MAEKRTIEQHIEEDKEILHDPTISPQMRRHTADELEHLERYAQEHKKTKTIYLGRGHRKTSRRKLR